MQINSNITQQQPAGGNGKENCSWFLAPGSRKELAISAWAQLSVVLMRTGICELEESTFDKFSVREALTRHEQPHTKVEPSTRQLGSQCLIIHKSFKASEWFMKENLGPTTIRI